MHSSWFHYTITRPYPYKWFTWAVFIGGTCAAILFSAINLAANGYNLVNIYTTDFNGTMSQKRWTSNFPFSLVERSIATCQAQDIPVNTQFFTNKLSFPYTLLSVWQVTDGVQHMFPSLKYSNNILENCNVSYIGTDLESSHRTAEQRGWRSWGPKSLAQLTCSISNENRPTYFNLTASYEYLPPTIGTGSAYRFIQPKDNQTQASLWWGESLLSWFWLNLAKAMGEHATYDTALIVSGSLSHVPSGNTSDITALTFFNNPVYSFVFNDIDSNKEVTFLDQCCINYLQANQSQDIGQWAANDWTPNIWLEADIFAKIFYSFIMVDVGQVSKASLFLNESLLQSFSANISQMTGPDKYFETSWYQAGPARDSYLALRNVTGPLGVTPSTIYTQYLCQIPQLKSRGSLVIAVLLANLVFLQALWQVLVWSTTFALERGNPTAKFCEGCLRNLGVVSEFEDLGGRKRKGGTGRGGDHYSPLEPEMFGGSDVGHSRTTQVLAMPKGTRRKPVGLVTLSSSTTSASALEDSREGLLRFKDDLAK